MSLAVSRTVPEPITRLDGSPEYFTAVYVRMSTGFATIKRMPLYFRFEISGIIDLKIATFFFTRSRRVSPGFWFAPAVTTIIAASVTSS